MSKNGGSVVNILANFESGYVWYSHSAAARAGVANLSYSLIQEWSPRSGIRINNVAPGIILGGGIVSGHYPKEVINAALEIEHQMPAGRFGTESEVAAAVTFLLSPASAYVNGVVLKVDGGYALSQTPHKAFGELYVKESHTPVFTGWGTEDKDVEALGFAQPFQDIMKDYLKIGKEKKGGSKL